MEVSLMYKIMTDNTLELGAPAPDSMPNLLNILESPYIFCKRVSFVSSSFVPVSNSLVARVMLLLR